ncbi:MAG: twin-arginine translocase subunit TatC [Bacteroidales bacterium]|nr:twin-arginine translocase subunit TatC [Bacteroidales bacterium]MBS3774442.1 twin-arginine translocase subunit TatC [Bacteroidales bacterium]
MKEDKSNAQGFLEHLEELRWHLVRSIVAIVIVAIVVFIAKDYIFSNIILAPKNPEFFTNRVLCNLADKIQVDNLCINRTPLQIINIKMTGQFAMHIMISLVLGVILAFPFIFWEFWSFLKPALYEKEIQYSKGAVFFSSLLFIMGVLFGYFVITPLSVHFLGSYQVSEQVSNTIHLKSYIGTIASVALAAGLIFELPILIYFLSKAGLVYPEFLKTYRRHAIIIIFIMAAVITPPDVFSLALVTLPLVLLYEVGIVISRRIEKQKEREEREEDLAG